MYNMQPQNPKLSFHRGCSGKRERKKEKDSMPKTEKSKVGAFVIVGVATP
jgi:hypothetical protein